MTYAFRFSKGNRSTPNNYPPVTVTGKAQFAWAAVGEHGPYAMFILGEAQSKRVAEALESQQDPFPGLVVEYGKLEVGFALNGARATYIQSCGFRNIGVMSMSGDSSAVLENVRITFEEQGKPTIDYVVELGFVVSLPAGHSQEEVVGSFAQLFEYAITLWSSRAPVKAVDWQ